MADVQSEPNEQPPAFCPNCGSAIFDGEPLFSRVASDDLSGPPSMVDWVNDQFAAAELLDSEPATCEPEEVIL
jgi:hypothetical protein